MQILALGVIANYPGRCDFVSCLLILIGYPVPWEFLKGQQFPNEERNKICYSAWLAFFLNNQTVCFLKGVLPRPPGTPPQTGKLPPVTLGLITKEHLVLLVICTMMCSQVPWSRGSDDGEEG